MLIKKIFPVLVAILFTGSASALTLQCSPANSIPSDYLKLFQIAADGTQPHEAGLLGLPSHGDYLDWSRHARANLWHDTTNANHIAGWFQVFYAAGTAKPAQNAKIQMRNYALWIHSGSQGWLLNQSNGIDGLTFNQVSGTAKGALNKIVTPTLLQFDVEYPLTFHGWGVATPSIYSAGLPVDLDGILVLFEAKALNSSNVLLGVGADYYAVNDKYIGDAGIGQFKYLTSDWKLYGFTTATIDQLSKFCLN